MKFFQLIKILISFVFLEAVLLFSASCGIFQGRRKQVFVFSTSKDNWRLYDWSKISTIVKFGVLSDELIQFAHSKNVTVSYGANFPRSVLYNRTELKEWVDKQIDYIKLRSLDGVNIDFEDEINCMDIEARTSFTILMQLLQVQLKKFKPNGQLSIDVAWSPFKIDNRCYDYQSLSLYADVVFIMSYDQRSQIFDVFDGCIAGPNSAYNLMVKGVKDYVDLGLSKEKLVLGVPWYGYDYQCINYFVLTKKCEMKEVPFRGVNCSDAAGTQIGYTTILKLLSNDTNKPFSEDPKLFQSQLQKMVEEPLRRTWIISQDWDDVAKSPYFTYEDETTKFFHQVWYDDDISLSLKYSFAASFGLAGVGFWEADSLEYSNSSYSQMSTRRMWDALPYPA